MLVFIRLDPFEGTDKTSDIVLVIERQRFLLSKAKGAKYDKAWDNCGPGLRIEMFLFAVGRGSVRAAACGSVRPHESWLGV